MLLLAARCSLLAARCSLLTARCSLLAARCSLFAARCLLLAARCPEKHSTCLFMFRKIGENICFVFLFLELSRRFFEEFRVDFGVFFGRFWCIFGARGTPGAPKTIPRGAPEDTLGTPGVPWSVPGSPGSDFGCPRGSPRAPFWHQF